MKKILIIGATSAIAQAVAQRYAARGASLYLMARQADKLTLLADDLRVRGARSVHTAVFDGNDTVQHADALQTALDTLGAFDICLIAYGTLSDQQACQASAELTVRELHTNAISIISLLTHLANHCETVRYGTLAVISSVAGDRGRQSNYVYGTAKAALTVFLQGLRNRLTPSGVQVLTIKPGFVDTPMTAHIARKGPLWATPERIAQGVERAIQRRRDVVYLPGFWRLIMAVIRCIPEPVFKQLKL